MGFWGLGFRHKCVHNLVDLEIHTHIIIYIYMNNMYVCHTIRKYRADVAAKNQVDRCVCVCVCVRVCVCVFDAHT